MGSLFTELDAATQIIYEQVFGEAFLFQPMILSKDVNAPRMADPDRNAIEITGIYSEKDEHEQVFRAMNVHTDRRPGVSMHKHIIEVDPRIWAIELKKGDQLLRLIDHGLWEVQSTDLQSDGRLMCNVSKKN